MPPETSAETPAVAIQKGKATMILQTIAYVAGGAAFGFGYHKLVGCSSGSCPITANPYISTLYGAVMGFLVSGSFGR